MKLAELREIAKARTQGPWEFRATEHSGGIKFVVAPMEPRNADGTEFIPADCSHGKNATFIATTANHIDALLDVAEAAKEFNKRKEAPCLTWDGWLALSDALKKLEEI